MSEYIGIEGEARDTFELFPSQFPAINWASLACVKALAEIAARGAGDIHRGVRSAGACVV